MNPKYRVGSGSPFAVFPSSVLALALLGGACAPTDAAAKSQGPASKPAAAPAVAPAGAPAISPASASRRLADAAATRRSLANAGRSIGAIAADLRGPKKVGKAIQRADVGFVAKSLSTGEIVASEEATRLLSAASNTKLFTTAAALVRLGPDFRFETDFRSEAPVADGVLQGDLWVIGGGDPTLASEPGWCPDGAEGALGRVALELRRRGISRIAGSLVMDGRLFTDAKYHPGWPARDRGKPHAIDVSALCVEHQKVLVEADASEGRLELYVTPRIQQIRIENAVKIAAKGPGSITARFDGETLTVSGTVAQGGSSATSLHILDGAKLFGAVALAAFTDRGLAVDGGFRMPQNGEAAPKGMLVKLQSAVPLAEVIRVTNQESDNLYADMILKVLGAKVLGEGTFAAGVAAVRGVVNELGLPVAGYAAVDGSGLARDSKLSAAALVGLLETMSRGPLARPYQDSLAVGGARGGTLRKRFHEGIFAGRVRAKTGSLEGVSSLSGYAESISGETFAFATLVNFEKSGSSKAEEEKIVRALVEIDGR